VVVDGKRGRCKRSQRDGRQPGRRTDAAGLHEIRTGYRDDAEEDEHD
jgi:hypothetical protein